MLDKISKPDFLIVGAAKSGTSSLHYYLKEHPQIFLHPYKELNFWHLYGHEEERAILKRYNFLPTTPKAYLELFRDADARQVTGDISPSYLIYYDDTINNLKALYNNWQDLKIIIILREPIEKIWSHYCFVKQKSLDPDRLSLWDSLIVESERKANQEYLPDLFYVHNTLYYNQVKAYLDNFKHVKILLFEDLKNNTQELLGELTEFLGIDDFEFENVDKKYNASIAPRKERKWVNGIRGNPFSRILPITLKDAVLDMLKKEEKLSTKERKYLQKVFKPEIKTLESLIEKDLSNWLVKYE